MREKALWITTERLQPDDLDAAMKLPVPIVISHRSYADLRMALCDDEAVIKFLVQKATEYERPIGVNFPWGTKGESRTMFIPPEGWAEERVSAWVKQHKAMLDEMFGEGGGPFRPTG